MRWSGFVRLVLATIVMMTPAATAEPVAEAGVGGTMEEDPGDLGNVVNGTLTVELTADGTCVCEEVDVWLDAWAWSDAVETNTERLVAEREPSLETIIEDVVDDRRDLRDAHEQEQRLETALTVSEPGRGPIDATVDVRLDPHPADELS